MKVVSIIFYILGGFLVLSAINIISIKPPPIEGIVYYIGLFVPALICIAIGVVISSKVKKKVQK